MIPTIRRLAILLALMLSTAPALADDPPPTPAQIEQAKKTFLEGKAAFEAKKFEDAVTKFKEAYKLSKNVGLLYNIGAAYEGLGMEDLALFNYRQYDKQAPADHALRATVAERLDVLQKKFNPGGGEPGKTEPGKTEPGKTEPGKTEPKAIKPPGTYTATDFQHQTVDAAPPGKPLDITGFVPEDSGFVVTLYYRTAGEGKYAAKVMKWRYKELIARIPANKMIGNAVHYYIEVKDTTGAVVTRSAKSTSPNLVNLEAGAQTRFYPDWSDDGDVKVSSGGTSGSTGRPGSDDDDPLNKKNNRKKTPIDDTPVIGTPVINGPANGFTDVGSSKFKYTKWGTTIATATLLAASVYFYLNAGQFATALEDESKCPMGQAQPCKVFDTYARDTLEAGGKSRQTLSNVTLGLGAATAVVAGYFWYRELTAKKRGELKASKPTGSSPEANASWIISPSIGESFVGAAAAARF